MKPLNAHIFNIMDQHKPRNPFERRKEYNI